MSYHIISIDSSECSLSCKDGQLTCRSPGMPLRSVPLEDVASIIVTSFSASIHSKLLIEAAKYRVALIICESFRPISIVLPANRSTDTNLTRAQLHITPKLKARLWQKTVDAKCSNQLALAQTVSPDDQALGVLEEAVNSQKAHKESICARYFWEVFGRKFAREKFLRARHAGSINPLLNYGYAVLLSTTLQKLFGVGLDPTFGIFHAVRENATPLAYDLMEPFRPCVDHRVASWINDNPGETEVTPKYRKWITRLPLEKIDYFGSEMEIQACIESVARSFRKAVIQQKSSLYRPWTQRNLKWAG